jgi:hypothetical protein
MRTLGLVSLGTTLVVVAFMWARPAHDASPASPAQVDAARAAAAFNLQQAAPAMQPWFADHGTYAGAALPGFGGVMVVRADASSFCLQAGSGPAVQHLVGPEGNAPVDGPC